MSIHGIFKPDVSDAELFLGFSRLRRLAHWWLRADAVERIGERPISPRSDIRRGEFVVLLWRHSESTVLEQGLALPLRWEYTQRSDTRLPKALAKLATVVAEAHRGTTGVRPVRLWLGHDCPDLSQLEFTMESAGLMLAGVLRALDRGHEVDSRIAASASISNGALQPVQGLGAKCAIASKLGLKAVLVAPGQALPSPPADTGASSVAVWSVDGATLEQQIESVVLALDAPPRTGTIESRCNWYQRHRGIRRDRDEAGRFFCEAIAGELAATEIDRLERQRRVPDRVGTMISIATGSWESVVFTARVLRPARIVLLHDTSETGSSYAKSAQAALRLQASDLRVDLKPLRVATATDYGTMVRSMSEELKEVVGETDRGEGDGASPHMPPCVDLTGGTTLMKLALARAREAHGLLAVVTASVDQAQGQLDVRNLRVVPIPALGADA